MDSSSPSQFNFQDPDFWDLLQSPLGLPHFPQMVASPAVFPDGVSPGVSALDTGYTTQLIPPPQPNASDFPNQVMNPNGHQYGPRPPEPAAVPAAAMGPLANTRKKKAPTLPATTWEPYKARIVELHIKEGRPLREVKGIMENEFGFTAE